MPDDYHTVSSITAIGPNASAQSSSRPLRPTWEVHGLPLIFVCHCQLSPFDIPLEPKVVHIGNLDLVLSFMVASLVAHVAETCKVD